MISGPQDTSLDPFDAARAEAMITGYDCRWGAERFEVLAVEAEYRVPLLNPETGQASRTWQRGGKLDVILRDVRTGRIAFMEHKTSGEDISPGSAYWRKLHMDGQVTGYFLGSDALGFPAEECIYDVLGKPGHRPLQANRQRAQAESPDEYLRRVAAAIAAEPAAYYQRANVVRLGAELVEAAFDDWQTAIMMRDAERLGRFPRNPDACFKWGRPCQFWDVCTGVASIHDPQRFRRDTTVNPELDDRGGLPVLTASRLRAARACSRLHQLAYLERFRPVVEPEPLRFGTVIHQALDAWWRAPAPERLDAALAALRSPAYRPTVQPAETQEP